MSFSTQQIKDRLDTLSKLPGYAGTRLYRQLGHMVENVDDMLSQTGLLPQKKQAATVRVQQQRNDAPNF